MREGPESSSRYHRNLPPLLPSFLVDLTRFHRQFVSLRNCNIDSSRLVFACIGSNLCSREELYCEFFFNLDVSKLRERGRGIGRGEVLVQPIQTGGASAPFIRRSRRWCF